ncbi:MAG: carboxypeptidase-like regulatory domain-containing protein [Candidatus Cryptobacteroides sp.]|nr:carboxypeptidase-like regulatory domain-containing protein [Candidatus Cryptobacteroides sp.]
MEASGEIIRIEGIIRDVQATPIAGVKVEAVGSGQESVTDGDGRYALSARSDDALVFTKNGYASQKIHIKGQDKVNVQMTK